MNEFRHNVTSGVDIINGCTLSSVQVLYYPSFLGRPCSSQSWWTWIVKWWNECLISHNPLIIKPHSIPTVSPEVIWNRLLYGSGHQPATNFEPNPCITTKVAPPNLWHTHVVMTSLATLNNTWTVKHIIVISAGLLDMLQQTDYTYVLHSGGSRGGSMGSMEPRFWRAAFEITMRNARVSTQ